MRYLLHARRNTHEYIRKVLEAKMLTEVERVAFAERKLIRSRPLLGCEENVFVSLMPVVLIQNVDGGFYLGSGIYPACLVLS